MKKCCNFLAVVFAVVLGLLFAVPCSNFSFAETVNQKQMVASEIETLCNQSSKTRLAGTEEELCFADYLFDRMSKLSSFSPAGTNNTGFQTFMFEYDDNSVGYSRNVIFLKDNANTDKKIVIGANYDSCLNETEGESQGLNASLSGVASVLCVAQLLNGVNLDFDLEVVFFGAGEQNHAGSFAYTLKLEEQDCEKILLMMNFDNLVVGKQTYFYTDELDSEKAKYVEDCASKVGACIEKMNTAFSVAGTTSSPLGLNYSHAGLESNNVDFLKLNINCINFFKDTQSVSLAKKEVNASCEDNLTNLFELYGENVFDGACEAVAVAVSILTQQDCFEFFEANKVANFAVFVDGKIWLFVMCAVLAVFWCVYKLLYERKFAKAHDIAGKMTEEEYLFEKFNEVVDNSGIEEISKNEQRLENFFKKSVQNFDDETEDIVLSTDKKENDDDNEKDDNNDENE